jgi:hypothetical protein
MVRRAQNLPADKEATPEEQEQRDFYHYNKDANYDAGINVGQEGFYDPEAGSQKVRNEAPESTPGPLLATDEGQPTGISANVIGRSEHIDSGEQRVVSSGRKRNAATDGE